MNNGNGKPNNNIGAFWKNEDKGYASGRVTCPHCNNEFKTVLFENMMKKKANHPDLNLLLSTRQPQKDGHYNGGGTGGYANSKPSFSGGGTGYGRPEPEREPERKPNPYQSTKKRSIF